MGEEGTGQGRAEVVQKLPHPHPADHSQLHLCQKQSFTRQWGTQGHLQDENQLHLPAAVNLKAWELHCQPLEAF